MAQTISSIRELIEALGGPTAVAQWAGVEHASAVSNWEARGSIPPGYHMRLSLEARRRGFVISPEEIFGLEGEDAKEFRDLFSACHAA